jgi:spermidine synthase
VPRGEAGKRVSGRGELLSVKGPGKHCVLRLLEPAGTPLAPIWERLREGTYDKPFILDVGRRRFLHLSLDNVQSAMHLDEPDRLSLAYTRMMMAFLLFNPSPGRILLLGLGGGSLAKFCYRHLPGAAITAIELNPDVIALREEFRLPTDDERFRVIRAEGSFYVSSPGKLKDVILVDACDDAGIAKELEAASFYQDARRRLSNAGIFVLNLCGDRLTWPSHLRNLHRAFGDEIVTLPGRKGGNVIVFAFKRPRAEVPWGRLAMAGRELRGRFGLDFPRYARRFARERRLCAPTFRSNTAL